MIESNERNSNWMNIETVFLTTVSKMNFSA